MGQVRELWLSYYLVLLSTVSKTGWRYTHTSMTRPKGTNDNKSTLVQVMAWHQTDDYLPEPMLTMSLGFNMLSPYNVALRHPLILWKHIESIIETSPGHQLPLSFNTLRPRQNGRHFQDDIFKCISLNESVWISIEISLKLVPKVSMNNIPTLVQIMAWRRSGDKPISEPMMVSLLTHICIAQP